MKKKQISYFFILLLTSFALFSSSFEWNTFTYKDFIWKGVEIKKNSSGENILTLKELGEEAFEFFIDFENLNASDLKDESGNYKISQSSYVVEKQDPISGNYSAKFVGKQNFIRVETSKDKILGTNDLFEDFFILFYVQPSLFNSKGIILSKNYLVDGKYYGLEIKLTDNKLTVDFNNFFYLENGTKTISLRSKEKLQDTIWNQVILYFNIHEKEITLFQNGITKDFAQFKSDPITKIGFHELDTNSFKIAEGFYGKLDNFLIRKGKLNVENIGKKYFSSVYDESSDYIKTTFGEVISKVKNTKFSNSIPINFESDSNIPNGSSLEFYLRFSNSYFSENAKLPNWISLIDFKEKPKEQFRYIQWKAKLRADQRGLQSPEIKKVQFNFIETLPPVKPVGLGLIHFDSRELQVCLKWTSNPEENVKKGGGYFIHYGISPDRMISTIKIDGEGNPITGLSKSGSLYKNYHSLQACIDNNLITKNAEFTDSKSLPVLQKGVTYYFKISAYNNLYNEEESVDQISPQSESVSASFLSE